MCAVGNLGKHEIDVSTFTGTFNTFPGICIALLALFLVKWTERRETLQPFALPFL